MYINFSKINEGTIAVFRVEGEIDIHSSQELSRRVNEAIAEQCILIILNLEKVSYMDTSALGIIFSLSKKVKNLNGAFCITKISPGLKKIFELTRLNKLITIYDTDEIAADNIEKMNKVIKE